MARIWMCRFLSVWQSCPRCGGSGQDGGKGCYMCAGSGGWDRKR